MSNAMPKEVDWELVEEKLNNIRGALMDIEERFREVPDEEYFRSKAGRERRDGICMLFVAVGESFKQIDDLTNRAFLPRYPEINRRKLIGFRNIIAHDYFGVDEDMLFRNCQTHLPLLLKTVNRMIEDLEKNHANP